MSDTQEKSVWYRKSQAGAESIRKLVIFDDGSATVEDGDVVEIGFDDDPNAWRDAVAYLEQRGFAEFTP